MLKSKHDGTEYYSYQDYPEFVAHATQTLGDMPVSKRHSRNEGREGFFGKRTWEEAVTLSQSGDMDMARAFKHKTLEHANRFLSSLPRLDPRYVIDGGMWVDINRYLRGEPECWGDLRHDADMNRPSLALVLNIACNSWAGAEDMIEWGSEIAGVILALQARGYPATVHIADKTTYDGNRHILHFPLNPNGGLLDMSFFASSVQPWFFRRVIFNWLENGDEEFRGRYDISKGGGYGHSGLLTPKDVQYIVGSTDNHVVVNRENTVSKELQDTANRILRGTEVGVA